MGRALKGDGSVYQRSDGRWCGKYTDALTGKTRYVYAKTKKEAKDKLKHAMAASEDGIAHNADGLTFSGYLDQWLESTKDTVGLRTWQRAELTVRLHVKPTLGNVRLDKVTALQLDALYREKLRGGLSPRTVQIIHATVHKALKQAVRWRLVRFNIAQHATPPKSVRKELQVLTKEQCQTLLRTAKRTQPNLYAFYALAVTTGARLGELLALQRADVDLSTATLRISKSVHNGRMTAPKTSAGRRTIRLSKLATDALREHLDLYAGDVWLFPSPRNEDESHGRSALRRNHWKPLLREAGLPGDTRLHDLRHTAASLLLGDGVPVVVVSQLLGHADPSITLRVYAHHLPDNLGTAALAMNGLLEEEAIEETL